MQYSDLADAKLRLRCKGSEGYPGPNGISLFFEKNNPTLKDVTKLSVARYSTTKNTFIIQGVPKVLGTFQVLISADL